MGKIVYLFGDKQNTNNNDSKNEQQQIGDTQDQTEEMQQITPDQEEAFLYRLGSDKESGKLRATWDEIAAVMNDTFRKDLKPETESTWRKRYVKIRDALHEANVGEETDLDGITKRIREFEKRRVMVRDERMSLYREIRSQSRQDMILDLFASAIKAYDPQPVPEGPKDKDEQKAIYAMLSDIHYGLAFDSFVGKYNPDIARDRVMAYADEIIIAGRKENASACFVSLMGDMVSGNIHPTIRLENKENIIDQIVGVSELIARFIMYLSAHFAKVIVNSVDGNHSRIDPNLENVLRKEKMDALIPWYCRAKLANQPNVDFVVNEFDPTIGSFRIGNKLFISVHGDMEKDLKTTATVIEKAIGTHIDYLLAGHMHVPEMRVEDTTYIRNGCVCGSGDDYTVKKRLFSPPCQVFMVIGQDGSVRSVYTVNLENVMPDEMRKAQ